MLDKRFFNRDPMLVARELLGKVIRHKFRGLWLAAQIIETEAYYATEKGSHSSLGYTQKRSALFMEAGTIYMYYARGGDSINISCRGKGNAVLLKAAYPFTGEDNHLPMIKMMQKLNPPKNASSPRPVARLCAGQTLLCRSLNLKVPEWDRGQFNADRLAIVDVGYRPRQIIQARRLGIPLGRDEHLMYRLIDYDFAPFCTKNVLTQRHVKEGIDYVIHSLP